jgi:hypothetical protein
VYFEQWGGRDDSQPLIDALKRQAHQAATAHDEGERYA